MRRLTLTMACVGFGWTGLAAQPALADTWCVHSQKPGCLATVQAAVDAAADGDTITIGRGTFAGGITVDKSVRIVGVAAEATTIAGGGPVITVGTLFAASRPTVSISRVTITGGVTSVKLPTYWATAGGGVWIPPAQGGTTGATVSIDDSVISRNTVAPAAVGPPEPFCGPVGCAFANGGGIANSGTLTITDTRVSNNAVGPSLAHEAVAGGIRNQAVGTLTLRRSVVRGNRVVANAPNGILAVAGGIGDHGVLTVEDSVVTRNSVHLDTSLEAEAASFTGGIELTGNANATITRTIVRGNRVQVANAGGPAVAGVGGISTDPDVSLVLRDSAVDHNSVSARSSATGSSAISFAGGLEIEGAVEVTGSRFVGNEVTANAHEGFAGVAGGGVHAATLEPTVISNSIVAGNTVGAHAASGEGLAVGGGVVNGGLLTLRRTLVVGNRASLTASAGLAHGGGIQNWVIPIPGFPELVQLTLIDTVVTGNTLSGSPGVDVLGGGIFTDFPVTLSRTVIAGNRPDQCSGC